MSKTNLVTLDVAAVYLGKNKQTLRRWDEEGKLKSTRGDNGYRYYDFVQLTKISNSYQKAKPFVKWAGGKTQLIPELLQRLPSSYGRYLEPFLGGGALFYALSPKVAILNDSNKELVAAYLAVQSHPQQLILLLKQHASCHSKDYFYRLREFSTESLDELERAARLIYLNKTCFNGLYRVNRNGEFNVPIGNYKNPVICDERNLMLCSEALKGVKITSLDYRDFIHEFAEKGDLVYLDPPYIPVSEYSDFDRYSKEKFRLGDQVELANHYKDLVDRGVFALLSNSSTELTDRLYKGFQRDVVKASRAINKKGNGRGKINEVIVLPNTKISSWFPTSRYMGSKTKLLPYIIDILKQQNVSSVFDAFSGSGVVSYALKEAGYSIKSNDFLRFSYTVTKALVENSSVRLSGEDINGILSKNSKSGNFVQRTFQGLYFSDQDNAFLDNSLANISHLECEYKRAISLAALSRACLKRRPRGIFTYVGFRYDDGRKDLSYSLKEHFLFSVGEYNNAVIDNGLGEYQAFNESILDMAKVDVDLVYLDPPYFSKHSDNDYVRRYHFIEGLCRGWEGLEIQEDTKTKKFKRFSSPFDSKAGTYDAFQELFEKYSDKKILISYSSNSLPEKHEMLEMLKAIGKSVQVIEVDYSYSFGNQGHKKGDNNNSVQEYLFLAT